MARLYRLHPDSSYLKVPRVFARVFCDPGTLPGTVRFYEALTSVSLDMDMDIPESGLHVVAVGPFLILEMDKGKLDRAGVAAETHVTILNANLDEAVAKQVAVGAQIVQKRWEAPRARECACGTRTDCWRSTLTTAPAPTTSTSPARHSADSTGLTSSRSRETHSR
jgi:predicted enzyme related to lactoylglutathione lyase